MKSLDISRVRVQLESKIWLTIFSICLVSSSWAKDSSASEAANETVMVGQAYGPELVLLQSPESANATALEPPVNLVLAALHAAGAAKLPVTASVSWIAALPPVRPQRIAKQEDADFASCIFDAVAVGVPVAASLPAPVPHDDLMDWFDPGLPGNCAKDDGLAHYGGALGLTAGMPVVAYAGFPNLKADYAAAGRRRPMNSAEKAGVLAYSEQWRQQFKKTYGKPFRANDDSNPYGPIQTLADAKILMFMRDARGAVVLRVSLWEAMSVGQHLTRVLVVDRLDGNRVKTTWKFARAQGVLG
jgi:hypothetical protein